jgi:hypothetical protein
MAALCRHWLENHTGDWSSALKQDIVTYHDVFYQRLVRRSLCLDSRMMKRVFEVGFVASELIQASDQ